MQFTQNNFIISAQILEPTFFRFTICSGRCKQKNQNQRKILDIVRIPNYTVTAEIFKFN